MKAYFEIHLPAASLAAKRGAPPCPAGIDLSRPARGRLPGALGTSAHQPFNSRLLEKTLTGGSLILELDRRTHGWRIQQPALAHWQDYLPATQGKWARGGDEITILDAGSQRIYFTLRQVQQMRGRAFYELLPGGLYQSSSGWRRIARPMQTSAAPCIWYGLAMRQTTERRGAAAVVLSDDRWFTFLMPESSAGSFRGYGWSVAFVLLTGYLDKGDLIAHKGSAPDYQFNFGGHWRELSAILHPLVSLPFAGLCEFALRNREALRALGKAALQGSCVDSDEKHILIGDLPGANIEAGMLAYSGECLVL